jgi:hypothetical protein
MANKADGMGYEAMHEHGKADVRVHRVVEKYTLLTMMVAILLV